MKKGDKVITKLGEGIIENFEVGPPLPAPLEYRDELGHVTPNDSVRVGVVGTKWDMGRVAYFRTHEITIPEEDAGNTDRTAAETGVVPG